MPDSAKLKIMTFTKPIAGFTLVELVVAIAVFAIAMTSLIIAFNPATTGSADPILQTRAAELGQAYLEEIIGKRFDENNSVGSQSRCGDGTAPACTAQGSFGPDAGENRSRFDDVDDYDGLTEVPTNALGTTRTNYNSYQVAITVTYAGGDLGLNAGDAKRIDLLITGPNGGQYDFTAYRTNF